MAQSEPTYHWCATEQFSSSEANIGLWGEPASWKRL
jgi:hypothetical protein